MKAPTSRLGQFSLMFVAEFVSFFIIVANTRAFTHSNYGWTAITDGAFSLQNFIMMKLMVDDEKARSFWAGLGYTMGGMLGSLLAIFVTSHYLGF
jgi:hypothetical protein